MYERILQTNEYIRGKYPWLGQKEEWIVLAEDMKEVLFTAHSFAECEKWLRNNCSHCEE